MDTTSFESLPHPISLGFSTSAINIMWTLLLSLVMRTSSIILHICRPFIKVAFVYILMLKIPLRQHKQVDPILHDAEGTSTECFRSFFSHYQTQWAVVIPASSVVIAAVLTCYQISGFMHESICRTLGAYCIVLAFNSVAHALIYLLHFTHLQRLDCGPQWVEDAKTLVDPFWDVTTLLSYPLAWLSWAVIFLIMLMVTALWHGRILGDVTQDATDVLGSPYLVTGLLAVAIIHTALTARKFMTLGVHCGSDEVDLEARSRGHSHMG